ncbi:MAG: ATP-dependent helicase RhlE [Candidatus Sumerlaeota bacterium]|nr:ATP-dependent helicase RhlE [Candidatus Sumerlaeota bacterium]
MSFDALNIHPRCLQSLKRHGITEPTPIQAMAIPVALEGRDLVAIAQTGTGKTLAFGLPALTRLAETPRGGTRMLVLAPTRELAQQVHDVLAPLAHALNRTITCVYGGVGMERQTRALRGGVSIVVATPGRLIDHMQRGNVNFSGVSAFVLDEADRMLDMGFLPDIRRIIAALPADRQTMMFSATFPRDIATLADTMQRDPVRVEAGAIARPADAVRQGVYTVVREEKPALLARILRQEDVGPTLVFLRTKRATDKLTRQLIKEGFRAESIHGGHSQNKRDRAIDGFRRGRHQILVATDVAARGLDVKGISHVVNYDIPATPDDYVHRIGRTARASASGDAITFVTPEEGGALRMIERAIGRAIERTDWEGAVPLAEPARVQRRSSRGPARPQHGSGARPQRPARRTVSRPRSS